MLALTTDGSVRRYFQDLPVQVGAKTGSAQVSAQTESNAVFVCFAPYDDPEIALAMVVEPVSYTHLDVYKRQILERAAAACHPTPGQAAQATPVSYTHLDVYKRQAYGKKQNDLDRFKLGQQHSAQSAAHDQCHNQQQRPSETHDNRLSSITFSLWKTLRNSGYYSLPFFNRRMSSPKNSSR